MDFSTLKDVIEFIAAAIAVLGAGYAGWKIIISPLKKLFIKIDRIDTAIDTVNNEILPVIQSLSKEFSKNSGKSIMDRILRIDDNTRLAELRSKLIASNLVATGMIEFDKLGNCIWANKAFLNMVGMDLEDLKSNGWVVCIEEDYREKVWNLWQKSLTFNIPFESEFVIKHQQTNNEKHIKCTIYPHRSVDNQTLGYYGTVIDS